MENKYKQYKIEPIYSNSIYTEEIWSNCISYNKYVQISVIRCCSDGVFFIEILDFDKDNILNSDEIILNNYNCNVEEISDSYDQDIEIKNINLYTEEQINEIKQLLYVCNNQKYDSNIDYTFNYEMLNQNNWFLEDTIYSIRNGCELNLI